MLLTSVTNSNLIVGCLSTLNLYLHTYIHTQTLHGYNVNLTYPISIRTIIITRTKNTKYIIFCHALKLVHDNYKCVAGLG